MCLESVRSARKAKKASFSSNPVDSTEEWRLYVVDLIHAISLVSGSWFFLEVDNSSASLSSFPLPLFQISIAG